MSQIDYAYFFAAAKAAGLDIIDYRGKWTNPDASKQWRRREVEDIKGLVVHQTAGGDSVDALGRYHTGQAGKVHIGDGTGMPGIAYTFFANKKGELYLVNDIEAITWSHGTAALPGDENKMFTSICFGGRFVAESWPKGTEHPTDEQVALFHRFWKFCRKSFHLTDLDLYGHYDFGKEGCPGDDLEALIEEYNREVDTGLETVENRQAALAELGYDPGPLDGQWGRKTKSAMQKFQTDHRLPVTQSWTKLTIVQMYRELQRH